MGRARPGPVGADPSHGERHCQTRFQVLDVPALHIDTGPVLTCDQCPHVPDAVLDRGEVFAPLHCVWILASALGCRGHISGRLGNHRRPESTGAEADEPVGSLSAAGAFTVPRVLLDR